MIIIIIMIFSSSSYFLGSGLAPPENERFPNRLPPSGQCHDDDHDDCHNFYDYNHYDDDYRAPTDHDHAN